MMTAEQLTARIKKALEVFELEVYRTDKNDRTLYTVCFWRDDEAEIEVTRTDFNAALSRALSSALQATP